MNDVVSTEPLIQFAKWGKRVTREDSFIVPGIDYGYTQWTPDYPKASIKGTSPLHQSPYTRDGKFLISHRQGHFSLEDLSVENQEGIVFGVPWISETGQRWHVVGRVRRFLEGGIDQPKSRVFLMVHTAAIPEALLSKDGALEVLVSIVSYLDAKPCIKDDPLEVSARSYSEISSIGSKSQAKLISAKFADHFLASGALRFSRTEYSEMEALGEVLPSVLEKIPPKSRWASSWVYGISQCPDWISVGFVNGGNSTCSSEISSSMHQLDSLTPHHYHFFRSRYRCHWKNDSQVDSFGSIVNDYEKKAFGIVVSYRSYSDRTIYEGVDWRFVARFYHEDFKNGKSPDFEWLGESKELLSEGYVQRFPDECFCLEEVSFLIDNLEEVPDGFLSKSLAEGSSRLSLKDVEKLAGLVEPKVARSKGISLMSRFWDAIRNRWPNETVTKQQESSLWRHCISGKYPTVAGRLQSDSLLSGFFSPKSNEDSHVSLLESFRELCMDARAGVLSQLYHSWIVEKKEISKLGELILLDSYLSEGCGDVSSKMRVFCKFESRWSSNEADFYFRAIRVGAEFFQRAKFVVCLLNTEFDAKFFQSESLFQGESDFTSFLLGLSGMPTHSSQFDPEEVGISLEPLLHFLDVWKDISQVHYEEDSLLARVSFCILGRLVKFINKSGSSPLALEEDHIRLIERLNRSLQFKYFLNYEPFLNDHQLCNFHLSLGVAKLSLFETYNFELSNAYCEYSSEATLLQRYETLRYSLVLANYTYENYPSISREFLLMEIFKKGFSYRLPEILVFFARSSVGDVNFVARHLVAFLTGYTFDALNKGGDLHRDNLRLFSRNLQFLAADGDKLMKPGFAIEELKYFEFLADWVQFLRETHANDQMTFGQIRERLEKFPLSPVERWLRSERKFLLVSLVKWMTPNSRDEFLDFRDFLFSEENRKRDPNLDDPSWKVDCLLTEQINTKLEKYPSYFEGL